MKQESLGKRIIKLALPATVENIFQTLVGFVDTLLIAQLGLVAVTAVGSCQYDFECLFGGLYGFGSWGNSFDCSVYWRRR